MKGWHEIDDELFFWTTLEAVRDENLMRGFDRLTVDDVMKAMTTISRGRFNPRELRMRLVQLDTGTETEFRKIALYLADCHAATATYDGTLKSTSKSRRQRFASICESAAKMLRLGAYTGRDRYDGSIGHQTAETVAERLERAARELVDEEG